MAHIMKEREKKAWLKIETIIHVMKNFLVKIKKNISKLKDVMKKTMTLDPIS